MRYTEHKFALDVSQTASQASMSVKKGDTARKLLIHLTERGYPYHIATDCYAVFTARKPDGKVVFNDCSIEDCVIVYAFTGQTVAVTGLLDCEIILYGSGGEQLTSACFHIIVEETIYDTETEIESADEYNALAKLIAQVQELKALQTVGWNDLAPAIADTSEEAEKHSIYAAIGRAVNVIVQGQTIQSGNGDPRPDNIREISGLGEMDANGVPYRISISMTDIDGFHEYAVELTAPLYEGDTAAIFAPHDGDRRCVETHAKKMVELDGTEQFFLNYADEESGLYQYTCNLSLNSFNIDKTNNNGRLVCSHYPVGRELRAPTRYPNIWLYDGTTVVLVDAYASAEDLKAYLAEQYAAGTPVTIVYPLATPEVFTHDPVSVLPASMPCEVAAEGTSVVEYYHDTKHYIDSKYANGGSGGAAVRCGYVELLAANWVGDGKRYTQVVEIEGITPYSMVDIELNAEQVETFHDKDLAFVAENEDGVVTVVAIGERLTNDYTFQVTITEVNV